MILTHWLTLIRAGLDSLTFTPPTSARGSSRRWTAGFHGSTLIPAYDPHIRRRPLPVVRSTLRSRQRLA